MKTIKKIGLSFTLLMTILSMSLYAADTNKNVYSIELSNNTHHAVLVVDFYYPNGAKYSTNLWYGKSPTTIKNTELGSKFQEFPIRIAAQPSMPYHTICFYPEIDINEDQMEGMLKPKQLEGYCEETMPLIYNISKITGKIKISLESPTAHIDIL